MSTVPETVDAIFDEHAESVAAAADGDDTARNRLIAAVMSRLGLDPDAAAVIVSRTLDRPEGSEPPMAMDLDGFEDHMTRLVERGERTESTVVAYTGSARKFFDWYADGGGERTAHVPPTRADVLDWLDHLATDEGLKSSSVQRHFFGIWEYFKWEGRGGKLADVNVGEIYPDHESNSPDPLAWDDVRRLRRATITDEPSVVCHNPDCSRDPWQPAKAWHDYASPPRCPACDTRNTDWSRDPLKYVVVQLLTAFGMRVGELADIDRSDVDLDARTLTIRRQSPSLTWAQELPLTEADVQALRTYLAARDEVGPGVDGSDPPLITAENDRHTVHAHRDTLRNHVKEVARDAGVRVDAGDESDERTAVNPRLLRHTVEARLDDLGYNQFEVGRYLGKTMGSPVDDDGGLDRDQLREMREAVDWGE